MKYVLFLALIGTINAYAAQYEHFQINSAGQRLETTQALIASAKGEQVYNCQSAETKVSKSGTSLTLKNVKKPKSDK